MSSEKHWIDDTHYREVNDDGTESRVYEIVSYNLFIPDECIEVAVHHGDGTTTAYEYDGSFTGMTFNGCRGKEK